MSDSRQVFEPVVLDDGFFITAEIWPDDMGFVMVRNPFGEAVRGSGFRGDAQAFDYMLQFMKERENVQA